MTFPIRWVPRDRPLHPIAVAARGPAAAQLVARARASEARWTGVGGPGWLVLLGEDPPWADGVWFLGRDPDAPRLLLPTHSAPEVDGVRVTGLVERRVPLRGGPFAVIPGWAVVPLGAAGPLDPGWSP